MDLQKTKYFLEQFVLSAFKKEIRTVVKFLLRTPNWAHYFFRRYA